MLDIFRSKYFQDVISSFWGGGVAWGPGSGWSLARTRQPRNLDNYRVKHDLIIQDCEAPSPYPVPLPCYTFYHGNSFSGWKACNMSIFFTNTNSNISLCNVFQSSILMRIAGILTKHSAVGFLVKPGENSSVI